MAQETFQQWLQKSSPSIAGFSAMTVTELLYKFEQYIQEHAVKGDTGVGLKSFKVIETNYTDDTAYNIIEISYTDNTTEDITIAVKNGVKGVKGDTGNGIVSVDFVDSVIVGNQTVNDYIITYTDGSTQNINIYAQKGTSVINISDQCQLLQGYDSGYDYVQNFKPSTEPIKEILLGATHKQITMFFEYEVAQVQADYTCLLIENMTSNQFVGIAYPTSNVGAGIFIVICRNMYLPFSGECSITINIYDSHGNKQDFLNNMTVTSLTINGDYYA